MIGIFRTSINNRPAALEVVHQIKKNLEVGSCTIDYEDCDHVLRVANMKCSEQSIICVVRDFGYLCEKLPDEIPAGKEREHPPIKSPVLLQMYNSPVNKKYPFPPETKRQKAFIDMSRDELLEAETQLMAKYRKLAKRYNKYKKFLPIAAIYGEKMNQLNIDLLYAKSLDTFRTRIMANKDYRCPYFWAAYLTHDIFQDQYQEGVIMLSPFFTYKELTEFLNSDLFERMKFKLLYILDPGGHTLRGEDDYYSKIVARNQKQLFLPIRRSESGSFEIGFSTKIVLQQEQQV